MAHNNNIPKLVYYATKIGSSFIYFCGHSYNLIVLISRMSKHDLLHVLGTLCFLDTVVDYKVLSR